jgi:hypothetical protein
MISAICKVEDMAEALGIEAPLLVEHPLADDQLPLEEPEADIEADDDRRPVVDWIRTGRFTTGARTSLLG